MREREAAAAAVKSNYLFVSIPVAILHAADLTRLDAAVWGVYFSRERLNQERAKVPQLSLAQVAFWAGTDRRAASRSIAKLVELRYLERVKSTATTACERGRYAYSTYIPERCRATRFLIASAFDRIETEDLEDGGGGSTTHGGVGGSPTGGGSTTHRGVGESPPLKDPKDPKEDLEEDATTPSRVPGVATDEPDDPVAEIGTEVETPNLDDGSVHAAALLEAKKEKRDEERKERKPRVKVVLTPDDELLREPSLRPEFNAWREKTPFGLRWKARDLVGYFVCCYLATRGEESTEFFATSTRILSHHGSNVSKFVKRWLGGDYRRAIVVVDKILARAESLGMPVRLGYFFTPANEGTVLRLEDKVRRGRETPAERNDRAGADTPENQARIARMKAEFVAEKRGRDGR